MRDHKDTLPPLDVITEELESVGAVRAIARQLPPIERAYATVRFAIMRQKLLTMINLVLPERGRILDVGCGFGLFSNYLGLTAPRRQLLGVDPNHRRIEIARRTARNLGIVGNRFESGTVEEVNPQGLFDGIFLLDVLHHVPQAHQRTLLAHLCSLLSADGVLVVKDITTDNAFKLGFTWALDRAMVGLTEPIHYRHHKEWAQELLSLGMRVRAVRVGDILPYPHCVLVARREHHV